MNEDDINFLYEKSKNPSSQKINFIEFFNLVADYDRKKYQNFIKNSNRNPKAKKTNSKIDNSSD